MALYTIRRVNNVSDEYRDNIILGKSNHSYAMNNKITSVLHKDSWLKRRCFIVAGGESMRGFDFSRIEEELTIGINRVFEYFPGSTINYCMDGLFYDQIQAGVFNKPDRPSLLELWNAYPGLHIFLTPMERKEFGKEVYLVKRLLDIEINREDLAHGIYQGTNSGTGAICLAAALGASTIYLLGYDLQTKISTHWHDGYEQRDIMKFNNKLLEYRDDISSIKPLLDQAGIRVVNLSKNSTLTCFESLDIDVVLGGKNANI